MPAYDTLYCSQANTRARELVCPVQALEGAEELVGIGHVETHSVVSHEVRRCAFELCEAELYACSRLIARELPRVAQEVLQHHPQQPLVAFCHNPILQDKLHLPFGVALFELSGKAPDQGAQVNPLVAHLAARHAGEAQEVFYETCHVFASGLHPTETISAFLIELILVFFKQRLAETVDASERGAQVVGDRITEGLQLLVYRLELCRALLDAL